jgi:molybdate transport system permease protein
MLAFARGMGEFGATLMVAGNIPGKTQTLALAIYDAFQAGDDPLAISLVLLTSAICLSILVAADSFLSARIGKGPRRKRKKAAPPAPSAPAAPAAPSPAAGQGGQA